jgi:hypothetical protein
MANEIGKVAGVVHGYYLLLLNPSSLSKHVTSMPACGLNNAFKRIMTN